uniref:Uncharacterized protein n=1 Tax=Rhizophora mucronata TaxID=61149 RepID=A0A2P2NK11_RHIMU
MQKCKHTSLISKFPWHYNYSDHGGMIVSVNVSCDCKDDCIVTSNLLENMSKLLNFQSST